MRLHPMAGSRGDGPRAAPHGRLRGAGPRTAPHGRLPASFCAPPRRTPGNETSITTNCSQISSTKRIGGQRIDRIEHTTHLIRGTDRISGGSSLRQTRLQPSAAYRRGSRGCSNPKWTAETSPTTGDVRRHSSKPYGCQLATGASGRRRRRMRRRTTASRR